MTLCLVISRYVSWLWAAWPLGISGRHESWRG